MITCFAGRKLKKYQLNILPMKFILELLVIVQLYILYYTRLPKIFQLHQM